MPSLENPERGPSFPHDPAHLTSNEPPPLEGGATGTSPSSPDTTTTNSDGNLEEFLTLPVLQNDNNIPIDPAILADDRPLSFSHLSGKATAPQSRTRTVHIPNSLCLCSSTCPTIIKFSGGV
ncbi:hypothetical protein ACJ73_08519 [Blastomyces percursus]|uniref:Uncharacterized protein n=1 Tax=Blastomyces percursus TaxID=1658174 RepID=A0A1J9QVB3_9EURO|nr:hypothetical protein ACJ73_08519 [Blastomyces percursus]